MNAAAKWSALSDPAARLILLIALPIAAFAPFDVIFSALTMGSSWLRMAWIAILIWIGVTAGAKLGLRLPGHGAASWLRIGLAAAALMAIYVILLDCVVFRAQLHPNYVAFLHRPLGERLVYFMTRAFNENVIYRLFAFGSLSWLLNRGRSAMPSRGVLAAAMISAQLINIGCNVLLSQGAILTPITLIYDALRYIVPGVIWAILYVRNGFATAEVASVGCHVFLQPAFSLLL